MLKFLDPDADANNFQCLISSSLSTVTSVVKFSVVLVVFYVKLLTGRRFFICFLAFSA